MDITKYAAKEGKFRLSKINPDYTWPYKSKDGASAKLSGNIEKLSVLQDKFYASNTFSLLLVIQAMDTGGKDGIIKHVMTGLNPQGVQVTSFKQPSQEELDHDYLWRINKCLPNKGSIGIFNRSYYEDVLIVRVHRLITRKTCINRYEQIRNYEKYLFENHVIPVKIFLHISKEEQKKRLIERIDDPLKNWKFAEDDLKEREYWKEYQKCYQEAIAATGTQHCPWYVVPANKKWFARLLVSEILVKTLEKINPKYPEVSRIQLDKLQDLKQQLLDE